MQPLVKVIQHWIVAHILGFGEEKEKPMEFRWEREKEWKRERQTERNTDERKQEESVKYDFKERERKNEIN